MTITGGYSPMNTWIHHRHRNKCNKAANSKRQARKGREERSEFNRVSLGIADTSISWHRVKYSPHNLYPKIPWVNDKPTRRPSARELQSAMEEVSSYHLLSSGLNVIRDPLDKKSIIAIIEFTPFSQLTPSEKDDLNFVSPFLHQTKPFISPVRSSSRVWGGLMWALGWRKSYDEQWLVVILKRLIFLKSSVSIPTINSPLDLVISLAVYSKVLPNFPSKATKI